MQKKNPLRCAKKPKEFEMYPSKIAKPIPEDIFRRLVRESVESRSIFALKNLSSVANFLVKDEISRIAAKNGPITIDIFKFCLEKNPFRQQTYEKGNKKHEQDFLKKLREVCNILEALLEISEYFEIRNLNAVSIGWISGFDETVMKRAPFMLQKRLVVILEKFKGTCTSIGSSFLRPSRFIRTFSHRLDSVTELDLGNMKALAALQLRSRIIPSLTNLEKFTWHHANPTFLKKFPNRKKMKKLILTAHPRGSPSYKDFEVLSKFESLQEFYFGFTIPQLPSRMVMDILLNIYQAIWKRKLGEKNRQMIEYFPKLREIGFWNAPENFFVDIIRKNVEIETVNFGIVTQDLRRMCSLDSIMQSMFRFEEAENLDGDTPKIKNLNMNLHSMRIASLDYYLPNLMSRVNQMRHLESVSIFVQCMNYHQMLGSWDLEATNNKKLRTNAALDSKYTKFSFHSNGVCGLYDLNTQLPSTLVSCCISLNMPPDEENINEAVVTVAEFIRKLSDFNHFPDIEELHIQIWGLRCLEYLVENIAEHLGDLKKLSILAMPIDENRENCEKLLRKIAKSCRKLEELKVSPDFLKILMGGEEMKALRWKENVRELARGFDLSMETCEFSIGRLPNNSYFVEPHYEAIFSEIFKKKEKKLEEEDEFDDYEDSFVDENEDIEQDDEEDELSMLEKKLAKESERRQTRYEKKMQRRISYSEEEVEEDEDDIIDDEEIDEMTPERNIPRSVFFDDEAVESDLMESDDEEHVDEEEEENVEYEDLADSEDDRLFDDQIERNRKRKAANEQSNSKRRKIIVVSDDED